MDFLLARDRGDLLRGFEPKQPFLFLKIGANIIMDVAGGCPPPGVEEMMQLRDISVPET